MEVLKNNGTFFYELNKRKTYEDIRENTRTTSIANTYKNEPQFQALQNISMNYARTGQAKYADPFPIKSRPYNNYYNGRNLNILNTLLINANKDTPDVITKHPLKVVGFY